MKEIIKTLKTIFIVIVILFVILWKGLVSILTKRYNPKKPPKYLIEAGADNGFVPVFRAYFAIEGDAFHVIREGVFWKNKCNNEYKYFDPSYYSINVTADSDDPETWSFSQSYDKDGPFDKKEIIDLFRKMKIKRTKYFFLNIREFDGYRIVYACNTDQDGHGTVLDQKSAFYRNGKEVKIPKKTQFTSIRGFYRLEE
ncbi:MAG: hypothetical protein K6C35_09125 [Eubacterium sp.]|nr:hypothetical protein [Eubacterium sp.]